MCRLHVVTGGKSNGHRKPLMLFVHGFPELWYSWRHQMKACSPYRLSHQHLVSVRATSKVSTGKHGNFVKGTTALRAAGQN